MIKNIKFKNFRNLNGTYSFKNNFNVIVGKNSTGKTNFLEGVKLAFSYIDDSYFKVEKSDFKNSDDSLQIEILVELENGVIPSLDYGDERPSGFSLTIRKTANGYYRKEFSHYEGEVINKDILFSDLTLPKVEAIPLARINEVSSSSLTANLEKFISSEDNYKDILEKSKKAIKNEILEQETKFKQFGHKFNQKLDIKVKSPKLSSEKLYITDGASEHNLKIGSGYRSIANIFICSMNDRNTIILVDELENHLHPALLRSLMHELYSLKNTFILATTHSPVVINEVKIQNLLATQIGNLVTDSKPGALGLLDKKDIKKLNTFLHPGRNELVLADNVVIVEGFTEELLIKDHLSRMKYNWTVVNAAGVMFVPYIKLALKMNKKVVVVSDNDIAQDDDLKPTPRFNNLKKFCEENEVRLIEVHNTLETDLNANGFIDAKHLIKHEKHDAMLVSKNGHKMLIVESLIEDKIDLSNWHVLESLCEEFNSH